MILIAHRGNTNGRLPHLENNPEYIDKAIKAGYSVEVDVRALNGKLFLGHDAPQYEVSKQWLQERKDYLWNHAKDRLAFDTLLEEKLHCFWHDTDDYTITTWGYVWAYPGKFPTGPLCIMVMPEVKFPLDIVKQYDPFGFCSDFVDVLKG
jgi:hypothetical protein